MRHTIFQKIFSEMKSNDIVMIQNQIHVFNFITKFCSGPAEPPGDCIAISNTSESLTINCVEVFSGGSTVYYALQSHTSKGSYRTLLNTTSLTLTIDDLYPNKEYQFRTCASNTEFWQTQQCGSPFQMTTASGPYTPPKVSNSKSEGHWPYVYAACAVGGFIVLLLVVVIAVILYKTQVSFTCKVFAGSLTISYFIYFWEAQAF